VVAEPRWQELRLIVVRGVHGAVATLVVRDVRGKRLQDRRVASVHLDDLQGKSEATDAWLACEAALRALRGDESLQLGLW